jgi:hypothetical protein
MYNCGRLQQHTRPVDDISTIILTTNNALNSLFFLFDVLLKESVSWKELLFVMFEQLIHCFVYCQVSSISAM